MELRYYEDIYKTQARTSKERRTEAQMQQMLTDYPRMNK
jgi:hypothetical protein